MYNDITQSRGEKPPNPPITNFYDYTIEYNINIFFSNNYFLLIKHQNILYILLSFNYQSIIL